MIDILLHNTKSKAKKNLTFKFIKLNKKCTNSLYISIYMFCSICEFHCKVKDYNWY